MPTLLTRFQRCIRLHSKWLVKRWGNVQLTQFPIHFQVDLNSLFHICSQNRPTVPRKRIFYPFVSTFWAASTRFWKWNQTWKKWCKAWGNANATTMHNPQIVTVASKKPHRLFTKGMNTFHSRRGSGYGGPILINEWIRTKNIAIHLSFISLKYNCCYLSY